MPGGLVTGRTIGESDKLTGAEKRSRALDLFKAVRDPAARSAFRLLLERIDRRKEHNP